MKNISTSKDNKVSKLQSFPIGFWNYTLCNVLDVEESVQDWQELGLNLCFSSTRKSEADNEYILQLLDACEKKNQKVVLCNSKTYWTTFTEEGREKYEEYVLDVIKTFGKHPAFYGILVGDEPHCYEWSDMQEAVKIVRKYCIPVMNFLPIVENKKQNEEGLGVSKKEYATLLANTVKETGLPFLSYDCYTQCNIHNSKRGLNNYFENLNCYKKASAMSGVPFITTLLSVGHWNYRVPTEDDLRWQVSTAVAHGAKGILWFFIYERTIDSSYRNPPINFLYEKTEMYEYLKRQDAVFNQKFADRLYNANLEEVYHYKIAYGGTKKYKNGVFKDFSIKTIYKNPLVISKFTEEKGEFYLVVNNSQTDIENIKGKIGEKSFSEWLAPGQMVILSK